RARKRTSSCDPATTAEPESSSSRRPTLESEPRSRSTRTPIPGRRERSVLRRLVPGLQRTWTVSLTTTLDGGRRFRRYKIPQLTNLRGTAVRVVGDDVIITAKSSLRLGQRSRPVTI